MPSDCQAVNSLSDDERLQVMIVPKSRETGRVITAIPGIKLSSNFRVVSVVDWKDKIRFEYLPNCWTNTSVVKIRNRTQTRGITSLIVCQKALLFIQVVRLIIDIMTRKGNSRIELTLPRPL